MGRGGITARACEQQLLWQERGMAWRRSAALSRAWLPPGPCSPSVSISFCGACGWQEQLPADAPHQGGLWRPHLTGRADPGWWLQHPGHQPQLGTRDKAQLKLLKWQESLILYVCHSEEQPEEQTLSNKQYFRHYEQGRALLMKDL